MTTSEWDKLSPLEKLLVEEPGKYIGMGNALAMLKELYGEDSVGEIVKYNNPLLKSLDDPSK